MPCGCDRQIPDVAICGVGVRFDFVYLDATAPDNGTVWTVRPSPTPHLKFDDNRLGVESGNIRIEFGALQPSQFIRRFPRKTTAHLSTGEPAGRPDTAARIDPAQRNVTYRKSKPWKDRHTRSPLRTPKVAKCRNTRNFDQTASLRAIRPPYVQPTPSRHAIIVVDVP